jgi:hypothetical protein
VRSLEKRDAKKSSNEKPLGTVSILYVKRGSEEKLKSISES